MCFTVLLGCWWYRLGVIDKYADGRKLSKNLKDEYAESRRSSNAWSCLHSLVFCLERNLRLSSTTVSLVPPPTDGRVLPSRADRRYVVHCHGRLRGHDDVLGLKSPTVIASLHEGFTSVDMTLVARTSNPMSLRPSTQCPKRNSTTAVFPCLGLQEFSARSLLLEDPCFNVSSILFVLRFIFESPLSSINHKLLLIFIVLVCEVYPLCEC